MKEVNIQDIQKIEDRELRWLVRYEQIVAWHKNGGLRKAAEAYHAQIAEAARQKAIAELRVAQINVIAATVARFDAKAVRNAQISAVAAKHRAEAAERQAIQEACDEVMSLEEIVPAADIDEILAQVSTALGIELPTSADRDDICQRTHTSMEDLKRKLGPSLATEIANPVQATQAPVSEHQQHQQQAEELISDVRRTAMLQGMVDDSTSDEYYAAGKARRAAEDKLTAFVHTLIGQVHVSLPPNGYEIVREAEIDIRDSRSTHTSFRTVGAWFRPVGTDYWVPVSAGSKIAIAEDTLDEATLDSAWQAANDQFDAGKQLHELGWKKPYKVEESLLKTLLDWHESAVRELANYRPSSASHGSSDLYLEGVDALRYAVEDYRKMILDYALGRDSLDVVKARMAA